MAKVLIVDNDPEIPRLLELGLRQRGHDVRTAVDRWSAYAIAPEFRPDVLVIDWMLGSDMDGVEVAQVLRTELSGLRTILVTGYPSKRVELRAADAGIPRVLQKPFGLAELDSAIQEGTR